MIYTVEEFERGGKHFLAMLEDWENGKDKPKDMAAYTAGLFFMAGKAIHDFGDMDQLKAAFGLILDEVNGGGNK